VRLGDGNQRVCRARQHSRRELMRGAGGIR
jgi:hypothetical protein